MFGTPAALGCPSPLARRLQSGSQSVTYPGDPEKGERSSLFRVQYRPVLARYNSRATAAEAQSWDRSVRAHLVSIFAGWAAQTVSGLILSGQRAAVRAHVALRAAAAARAAAPPSLSPAERRALTAQRAHRRRADGAADAAVYSAHYRSASASMRRAFSPHTPMPLRRSRALVTLRAPDAPPWLAWIPSSALRDTR